MPRNDERPVIDPLAPPGSVTSRADGPDHILDLEPGR
jgi:hypothetical protein